MIEAWANFFVAQCGASAALLGLIATVSVRTPKNSEAPMSFSASIKARLTPMAIAGRASGIATRRKTRMRFAPSVRATSSVAVDCIWKTARTGNYL